MRYPPAIVLGIDSPIGLTLVRELGSRGVEVHGVARDRRAVGLGSRWLARGYVSRSRDARTIALLNDIAQQSGAEGILAVSEADIRFLNDSKEKIACRLLTPDARMTALAADKRATLAIATKLGVRTPATLEVASVADIGSVAVSASYPVVLKWAKLGEVFPLLSEAKLPLHKAEYCYGPDDLIAVLRRYASIARFPLVQSFCPGHGLGQMAFMRNGEPLLRFQHRRLREWPPEGGVSSACVSLPLSEHEALFEQSIALLRAMRWEGAAMVEYRHDPESGSSVLMEVNGRFWGSQPLAYHAGAHFGWLTYAVLGLGLTEKVKPYHASVLCRYMAPEVRRLWTIWFRSKSIQNRALRFNRFRELVRFVADFFSCRTRYYVFSWSDPGPWMHDIRQLMRKHFVRR